MEIMDAAAFKPGWMTGRLVPIPHGRPDTAFAFIPQPLPPQWTWPGRLWPLLLEARICLSRLDGTGKHLPNPELLLRPMANREAQLSSQLEGTITDPQQQVLFQIDPGYPISVGDPKNALREVFNYQRALRLRLDDGNQLPLSLRLIRDLHRTLLDGVRGSDQRPGEFRQIQNQIGRPARYVPPPPAEVPGALDALEKYLHASDRFDPLVRAFLVHYQFEAIHPFQDGNGRVGRLLLSLAIAEWCQLSSQWLYMSPYFEARRDEYMNLLLAVSTEGAWEPWIGFCLNGVIAQSRDTEIRCDRLLALQQDFHQRLRGGSLRLAQMVDRLFAAPVISVPQYQRMFEITHPTARSDLRKLEAAGVIAQLPGYDPITYYCAPIYDITFGGAESV